MRMSRGSSPSSGRRRGVHIVFLCSVRDDFFRPTRCDPSQIELFRLFSQKVHLDGQLPDLGVQLAALALEILITGPFPAGPEDAAGPCGHGFLPVGSLHRVDVKIHGDLLDGLNALERLKRHAILEFGVVSSSFCFHFV